MRKIMSLIMATLLTVSMGLASACQYDAPKSIVGAQLNDKGELILTYSDDTTQNLGVVKGEDGKDGTNGLNGKDGIDGVDGQDGKDGVDLTACEHSYNDWEVQLSPTCTSIGYNTRTCSLCSDLEYQFTEAFGHTYKNPVDIINTYEQHLVSKTCSTCGDTKVEEAELTKHIFEGEWEIKEYPCATVKQRPCLYCDEKQTELIKTIDFGSHTFDENTLCTTCGHQEFIQSEEYFEDIEVLVMLWGPDPVPQPGLLWWNKDRTFALKCAPWQETFFIYGYMGNPVNVVLPIYDNLPYCYIQDNAFQNCTTLKSIYIPDAVTRIEKYAFDGCTALESVRFSENLHLIGKGAFRNCISLKTLYFKNNNCALSHTYDYRYDPTFENCLSLTEIYFPLYYDMSGSTDAFSSCTALKKIYVSAKRYDTYVQRFKNFPNNLEIIIYNTYF